MVLIQEDDANDEHVIYYLSRSIMPTEIKYLHVKKLALAAVQAVQCFRHYILSHKTTVISNCNPMQHILTRQFLGGKYSKWIVILQEFNLEFERAKSKKSLVFAELICNFPYSEMKNVTLIHYLMNPFSSSTPMIFGMEISLYISKPRIFGQIFLVLTDVKYDTKFVNILSPVGLHH
jgi:hypothetical protein